MTGLKLTSISKVRNWLLHLGWVSGYKTDWRNLKPQCNRNHGKPGHRLVLPGLGHHRTIGLGYTPLDQRERRPGLLVEPGHLQDRGLSHQQRMGRSGCQPDRDSTCVEREPVGSRRQHVR